MELINHASLQPFVTFGVEANCDHLYRIDDIEELKLAAQFLENPLILGGGSNVLPIGDIHRNVLRIELGGLEIVKEEDNASYVRVAAGEGWHDIVMWSLNNGLGGIENLSLIPGTMGAAPIQNIGAYGVELESVFDSLEAIEIGTGKMQRFDKETCRFGYRDSIFKHEAKGKFVITAVTMKLSANSPVNVSYGAIQDVLQQRSITTPTHRDVSDAVISIRQSKLPDPKVIGNAGSFFKNPILTKTDFSAIQSQHPHIPHYAEGEEHVKIPAGWLIEQAGWKGKRMGHVGSYEKQALVLVNHGGGSGEEVWALAEAIIGSVREQFGVELHPEVNLWK